MGKHIFKRKYFNSGHYVFLNFSGYSEKYPPKSADNPDTGVIIWHEFLNHARYSLKVVHKYERINKHYEKIVTFVKSMNISDHQDLDVEWEAERFEVYKRKNKYIVQIID